MKSYLFHILNFPLWIITLLPLRLLYILSDFFYILVYHLIGYRKKVVFTNIINSFPEKSNKEVVRIAKSFYRHLCDYFIESFYIFNMSEKEINNRFRYKNPEVLIDLYKQNRSIIATIGHYGNWEWLCSLPLHVDYKVFALYSPLNNKYFDELFKRLRGKFGVKMLPMKTAFKDLALAERNKELTLTYFLTDQRPVWSSIRYWTTFLNQETPVFLGSELISKKLDFPVVFFEIKKIKRGYYEVEFKLLTKNPKETSEFQITEAHTKTLENIIINKPDYWLWSHKRWKFKREDIEKRQRNRND